MPDGGRKQISPSARRSREYREHQAAMTGKTSDPERAYTVFLPDALVSILAADRRFKSPAGPTERNWRTAVAEVVARILKDGNGRRVLPARGRPAVR